MIACSRLADGIALYSILSAPNPSCAAIRLAISMSKPEYLLVVGSLYPRFGWSSFTPMITLPRAFTLSNVGDPATVTALATGVWEPVLVEDSSLCRTLQRAGRRRRSG